MGLKLLLDEECPDGEDEEENEEAQERRETLMDISVACKTAVDILNDLLCFVSESTFFVALSLSLSHTFCCLFYAVFFYLSIPISNIIP